MPAPATAPTLSPPPARGSCTIGWIGAALLALAVLAAWSNSFNGPFVLDDLPAIADNPTLRSWSAAFSPPHEGQTVTGRPLVNLSFALNHALAAPDPVTGRVGERVFGYHLLNIAIHLGAALALFGLVRRTLHGPVLQSRFPDATGDFLAFAAALLWAVHPLQTGAVTYIAQRAESLCALCYLLTLYCLARGAASARPWRWFAPGIIACLAGMASKEVMVSAPVLALLYDRTFVAGSFGQALRRRWAFYAGLAATWLLLVCLVVGSGNRGATAGFGISGNHEITSWTYLLRQCEAIVQYLRLSVWPDRLVSDYGFDVIADPARVWWQGLLLLALFGATLWALWRRPAWGFLGLWFFAILAPSSSIIPVVTETAAEHRMYLPLAALMVAAVLGTHALARRFGRTLTLALAAAGLIIAAALGAATHARNQDYQSSLTLWQDVVRKRPGNARGHQELALAYARLGRLPDAFTEYREAIRILPGYSKAHHNYASALADAGQNDAALAEYILATRIDPNLAEAFYGAANILRTQGHLPEAIAAYAEAVRLKPNFAPALNNLANLLGDLGRNAEAVTDYELAIRAEPAYAEAHANLGNALGRLGRLPEAITHFEAALQLKPDFVDAHMNFGVVLFLSGRKADAAKQLEIAVRLDPNNTEARSRLAAIRAQLP